MERCAIIRVLYCQSVILINRVFLLYLRFLFVNFLSYNRAHFLRKNPRCVGPPGVSVRRHRQCSQHLRRSSLMVRAYLCRLWPDTCTITITSTTTTPLLLSIPLYLHPHAAHRRPDCALNPTGRGRRKLGIRITHVTIVCPSTICAHACKQRDIYFCF